MTDKEIEEKEQDFDVYKIPVSHLYSVRLTEEIVSPPSKYNDLCKLLEEDVEENDTVHLHLSNYGGCCDSAITIINAVRNCRGTVKAIINAPCYSAATTIALACDELEVRRNTFLMFHNFSANNEGKGTELKNSVLNTERQIHDTMKSVYRPFLTPREINDIFNDKDIYIHWNDKDLPERIQRHFIGEEQE